MAGKLTKKFVREVTDPGRYSDGTGSGLTLFVSVGRKGGLRKSWVQRLSVNGRRLDRGLGSTRWLSVTEAREVAAANWLLARRGGDPFAEGDDAKRERHVAMPVRPGRRPGVPTLAALTAEVIVVATRGLRNERKARQVWESVFSRYVFPEIGDKPIDAIDSSDVLRVLMPLWTTRRPTAKLIRTRLSRVFAWAMVAGHRSDDPAATVLQVLPKNGAQTEHQPALHHRDVPAARAAIRGSGGRAVPRLALEFVILTACRNGEARGATWGEIDFEAATWTIPADRMKNKEAHTVPLSGAAVAVLRAAREHSDGGPDDLVFPSARGRILDNGQLSRLCEGLGCVPHGFRSSFKSWAGDSGYPRELAEGSIAHKVGSLVERAYMRSDLLERRRPIMEAWAAYLTADTETAN